MMQLVIFSMNEFNLSDSRSLRDRNRSINEIAPNAHRLPRYQKLVWISFDFLSEIIETSWNNLIADTWYEDDDAAFLTRKSDLINLTSSPKPIMMACGDFSKETQRLMILNITNSNGWGKVRKNHWIKPRWYIKNAQIPSSAWPWPTMRKNPANEFYSKITQLNHGRFVFYGGRNVCGLSHPAESASRQFVSYILRLFRASLR